MFTIEGIYTDTGERMPEIERLEMELILFRETAAAVERDLRLRLSSSEREISQLRERLSESESAIHQIRSNHQALESERLSRKRSRRCATAAFRTLPLGCSHSLLSTGGQINLLESDLEVRDLNVERAPADGLIPLGDSTNSSDSDTEESLLLQNLDELNASTLGGVTYIPIAKKRKMTVKLANDGALSQTKDEHWESMFALLLQFDSEHKHCNVPQRYKFHLLDGNKPCLGRWLQFQRVLQRRNKMRSDRLLRMQALVDSGKLFWDFNI